MISRDQSKDVILLDEAFLRMSYSPADRLIQLQWNGHARSEDYRKGLQLAVEMVAKHDLLYWLADLRAMTVILQADEKWSQEVWFPTLFKTGLEKMAIVQSADYFNQTSVQRSFTAVNGKLSFKVAWFPATEEAVDWLFRKEAVSA